MSVVPKRTGTCASVLAAALIFGMAAEPSTAASRVTAKGPECPSSGSRVAGFARAVDGGGFLTTDGDEVRLSGILAPGAGGEAAAASAIAAARDALANALRDRTVTLAAADAPRDRYGRTVAQVFADGIWVQKALLEAGDVRAAPDLASAACAKALLSAEAKARDSRSGQWRGVFRVSNPGDIRSRAGSFQVVEGRVVTASVVLINFGADYRTDFTVTIEPDDMRTFRLARFDVPGLSGKRIRVRGWVEFYNGPEITITTPAAIEVLE